MSARISEARFDTLSTGYEEEQANVKRKILMLEDLVENSAEQVKYSKQLLTNVRKYTAPDKSSGHRAQKIEIYYNAVGIIDLPTNTGSKQDSSASKLAV